MTDLAEIVARAEDRSWAAADLKKLIDETDRVLVFDGTNWTFQAPGGEGEKQWTT